MSRHPATWRTQAALAIGKGSADDAEFAAADRVLDALEREGALLTDRQRALLRPSARETPGDRPSAPVAARTDAVGTSGHPTPGCPSRIAHQSGVVLRCWYSTGHPGPHGRGAETWTGQDVRLLPTSPTGDPR